MNIQDWFPLELTGLISLLSKGLSRVFSNTTVQKHLIFSSLPYGPTLTSSMTTGKTIALTILTSLIAQLVKNLSAMQETWFYAWVRKICWRRDRLPTPVFWPGEFHGLYSPATATAKSLQSCPTLCDPTDSSPPGSLVPGILQARTLEWVTIAFSNAWKWKVKVKLLSRVQLLATAWTVAYQAPPSMGFARQEYWSGVPLPSLLYSPRGHKEQDMVEWLSLSPLSIK